jgi:LPXTG-site transpeptidase (sortase) family protein
MGSAILLVGYVGLLMGYESYEQHRLASAWDRDHPAATISDATIASSGIALFNRHPHLSDGETFGRLTLSSVGFNAMVTEGSDSGFLSSGPAHDDRTAYPGESSTILIGNHNGFSFSWNSLKVGDPVVVEMAYGRYHYTISKRYIVDGGDTTVVDRPRSGETLLLSTCWPLWAGSFAHQRLVFEAVPAGAGT